MPQQSVNCSDIVEQQKHLRKKTFFPNFMDLKKAFDHMTYVDVITSVNIKKRLLKITKSVYKDTSSVVCMKRRIDDPPEFPYNSRSKSRLSPFASPLQFVP